MATETRQARAATTRQRILESARALFVTHGYRSTSLRDIAAAAGISHPGLLGHFASKDELLAEVVAEHEAENESVVEAIIASAEPGHLIFGELAARNARTEGYLELFAALTGEASTPGHPAHDRMRARYRRLRALTVDVLEDAVFHGVIAPDRDVAGEATRFAAGWDGLQLQAQYLPGRVDVAALLKEREGLWSSPVGWRDQRGAESPDSPAGPLPPVFGGPRPESEPGYAVGRRRRAQILADATRLFSREGYGDTSLRDIAQAVGVSKSTLLHHYPSKELLLSAVLAERDGAIRERSTGVSPVHAADALRSIPDSAAANGRDEPGLIELYAVLSCEAVPSAHPAHEYFATRFTEGLDYFRELFRLAQIDGDLPAHRDPEHEAIWLTALWDGLQYQWLYDRDAVDIAAELRAHLEDVLPRR